MATIGGGAAGAGLLGPISSSTNGLFGVFDGHGGIEVAEFCSRHFERALKENSNYLNNNFEVALQETFLKMDDMLQTPEGKAEIMEISK